LFVILPQELDDVFDTYHCLQRRSTTGPCAPSARVKSSSFGTAGKELLHIRDIQKIEAPPPAPVTEAAAPLDKPAPVRKSRIPVLKEGERATKKL